MQEQLPTFEKCKAIRNEILRVVGESTAYKSWDNDYKLENIMRVPEVVKEWEHEAGSFSINPAEMTDDELQELGFSKWDESSELRLIPIWLYPYLAHDIETQSISGSKHTTREEINTDHRFGCLAYGVRPK